MNAFIIKPTTTTAVNSSSNQPSFTRRLKAAPQRAAKPATASLALLALSAALSGAAPSFAEVKDGQFEISPFAGYHIFEDDQNLEDGLTYGIRLGYSFTPHWAIEGAISRVNSSVDDTSILGASPGQFRSPTDDVDLLLYQLDALYHFLPDNKFSPYIVGGYGVTDYSPSISDDKMSTFNFGVGAKYWVSDNLAVRFDLRDHLVSEVFDDSYHNISATLGVSFAFGGREASKPYRAAMSEPVETNSKPVSSAATPEVLVLEFEDVHFDFDKSTLTQEAQNVLQRSIVLLRDNPEAKVRIAGYTSAAGTAAHNQKLSEQRAQVIEDYLITKGDISKDRLSVIGYGDTRPGSYEASPTTLNSVAAKENMRALFEIVVE